MNTHSQSIHLKKNKNFNKALFSFFLLLFADPRDIARVAKGFIEARQTIGSGGLEYSSVTAGYRLPSSTSLIQLRCKYMITIVLNKPRHKTQMFILAFFQASYL